MKPLEPRERKLVAVGLLVGAVAVTWLGVIAPLVGGAQARSERRQELLARYQANQRLMAALPSLRAEALVQRRSAALYQITAPTETLATEALRQRLSQALTDAGGTVTAVQPIQSDVPRGWISVRADARINLTQLLASLRRLENEPPYVVVDYASLGAERALLTGHAAPLDVRLQVSALVHAAPPR
jgi:general secretion pathway protein M